MFSVSLHTVIYANAVPFGPLVFYILIRTPASPAAIPMQTPSILPCEST